MFIMKSKKNLILSSVLVMLLLVGGVTYAYFNYSATGERSEIVTGQIYMNYTENSNIYLTNAFPESKEQALARTDENGVFNFTIDGKNTSKYDIYYGINLVEGEPIDGKTVAIKPEHIMIYLECDGEVLIDGIRYSDWDNQRIWVEKIEAGTNTQTSKNYTLRMWIDENVKISNSSPNADYKTDEWNNAYVSLKVNVNGNLDTMNMPLSIETSDTYVENNKAYFIAKISNFYDMNDLGKTLDNADNMNLKITGTNSDIVFSYKDSEGNVIEETSETLDLNYIFNKNKTVEIQVFVTPKNDTNSVTDLNFVLTRNNEEVQRFHKYMTIYGNNFCLNNGFDKLYDCILASDSLATDVETAKVNIEAKGEPNLNDTAPTYTYVEDITYDVDDVYSSTGYKFYFGDSYEFNATNGTYRIYNKDGSGVITDHLRDTYQNYYTCGYTGNGYTSCQTIYRIDLISVSGTTYTITQGDLITYKVSTSIRSEVGLYKTEDDYGDSYFYRGDVTNNNVLFGGYYWKIIRTNGDNSIRLIYNGESVNATGNATLINNTEVPYSQRYGDSTGARYSDPTFVGYMYGKNFDLQTSNVTTYAYFAPLTEYYFADGYEFDEEKEVFRLKKINLEPVSGTFAEMKDSYATYPYTCKSTSIDGECQVLLKANSWVSDTEIKVQFISYSSVDKDSTRTNELSSNVKVQVENWYNTNIVGKNDESSNLITDYIVDGTFCNDRSTPNETYASGYSLSANTYYGAHVRLTASDKVASLKCSSDMMDKFSYTSSKGNGLLDYPVALITADEVAFAGGLTGVKNENFYLKNAAYYWTMTPSNFYSSYAQANVSCVYPDGMLNIWGVVAYSLGVRPVINLRSDVLISSGDGTIDNPFTLKLA